MRLLTPTLVALLTWTLLPSAEARQVRLTERSVMRLATVQEGIEILVRRDRFVRALSPFDLDSRLDANDVSLDDYLDFVGQQVLPWDDGKARRVAEATRGLAEQLRPYALPLPETVWVVLTTGREEGGAAYCRKDTIVLPRSMVERGDGARLQRLLAHELFHIMSQTDADLRHRLYALIGFRRCGDVALPEGLRVRKITNPDAPTVAYSIDVEYEGEMVPAAPVLLASKPRYEPGRGGSFFRYLTLRLILLEGPDQAARPRLVDGEPVLIDPRASTAFFWQIGVNTNYIIHPDEILADNFVRLVTDAAGQPPTPRIVERMRQLLELPAADGPRDGSPAGGR